MVIKIRSGTPLTSNVRERNFAFTKDENIIKALKNFRCELLAFNRPMNIVKSIKNKQNFRRDLREKFVNLFKNIFNIPLLIK